MPYPINVNEDRKLVLTDLASLLANGANKLVLRVTEGSLTASIPLASTPGNVGVTIVVDAGTGFSTMTLTEKVTGALATWLAQELVYFVPSATAAPATLSYASFNGAAAVNSGTVGVINVTTGVNDAPVVDAGGPGTLGNNYAVTFNPVNDPVRVVASDFTITDVDTGSTLQGATVVLKAPLTSNPLASSEGLSLASGTLGVPIGSITVTANADKTQLTLTGNASLADYEGVLKTIVYNNSSIDSAQNTTSRHVEISVTDASGAVSNSASITALNPKPGIPLGSKIYINNVDTGQILEGKSSDGLHFLASGPLGAAFVEGCTVTFRDVQNDTTVRGTVIQYGSVLATTTIGVQWVPVAVPKTSLVTEGNSLDGTLTSIGFNANSTSYSSVHSVAGLTIATNGSYSFNANDSAYDHLSAGATTDVVATFTVNDSSSAADSATLTITVTGENDAPSAHHATNSATEGGSSTGTLTSSDVDDNHSASYALQGVVAGLTIGTDGSYNFDASDSAYDHLSAGATTDVVATFTVTDDQSATGAGTLTITVTGVNDAPVIAIHDGDSVAGTIYEGESGDVGTASHSISGTIHATDADGDALSVSSGIPREDRVAFSPDSNVTFKVHVAERMSHVNSASDENSIHSALGDLFDAVAHGFTVTLDANNMVTWDLTVAQSAIDLLQGGDELYATFDIKVSDGIETVHQPVEVTIAGKDDAYAVTESITFWNGGAPVEGVSVHNISFAENSSIEFRNIKLSTDCETNVTTATYEVWKLHGAESGINSIQLEFDAGDGNTITGWSEGKVDEEGWFVDSFLGKDTGHLTVVASSQKHDLGHQGRGEDYNRDGVIDYWSGGDDYYLGKLKTTFTGDTGTVALTSAEFGVNNLAIPVVVADNPLVVTVQSAVSSDEGAVTFATDIMQGHNQLLTAEKSADDISSGTVTAIDVWCAQRMASGYSPNGDGTDLNGYQVFAADVNQDGNVDGHDVWAIWKMALHEETSGWVFVDGRLDPDKELYNTDCWQEDGELHINTDAVLGLSTSEDSPGHSSKPGDDNDKISGVSTSADSPWLSSHEPTEVPVIGVVLGDVNGSWSLPEVA